MKNDKIKNQKLFVYGNFKLGHENAYLLEEIQGKWKTASVKGELHRNALVSDDRQPSLSLSNSGKDVPGYLFSSENLSELWDDLDEMESDYFKRTTAQVFLDKNTSTQAFVYVAK